MQVLARAEFKLKYAGSVLGYVWSLAKPMAYFTVLWVVFRGVFNEGIHHYPLYLLIGIVLNTFLVDAVSATLPSLVSSGPTIRRISFPPLVIPLSTSLAAAMTFLVNCVVVGDLPRDRQRAARSPAGCSSSRCSSSCTRSCSRSA